jgi:hypothetical protein
MAISGQNYKLPKLLQGLAVLSLATWFACKAVLAPTIVFPLVGNFGGRRSPQESGVLVNFSAEQWR